MADEVKSKSPAEAPASTPTAKPWWKSALLRRWLVVLVVGSLVIHGVVFVLLRKSVARATVQPECMVGTFTLVGGDHNSAASAAGKFDLHVRFVDDLDASARQRMIAHEFRVRESIEGLLRNSQGTELDEPALTRLKHQIQERVDEAIDLRAVAEVIITDLAVPTPVSAPVPTPVSTPIPTAASAPVPTASTTNAALGY
jgi:flagellar basal body-associated protein FliL